MKKIKILFFIHDLSFGGAEKVLVNLVNNMDLNKFDVTVQTIFDVGVNKDKLSKKIKYIPGFKYMFRGNSYFFKIFSPKLLYKFFVRDRYDIVVSYLEGPCARIISGCDNLDSKLVSWIHTGFDSKKLISEGFRNYSESVKCYNRFDKIIFICNSVKDCFLALVPQIKNYSIVYNTNESNLIINRAKENIEIELNKEDFNIIAIGKITHNKGFDRLVRIINRLKDDYSVHLYILGAGEQQEEIQNYMQKEKINEYVTFLGYQSNPYKYLAKCDLYVCSSFREGFSTAATEALIVGTPVCTVDVSGMREMLGYDNEYGLVVDNEDESLYQGIKLLLDNQSLYYYYKNQALIRGRYFSTDSTVRKAEKTLVNLVGGQSNE